MIIADKIINERKKNGWSQEDLAEKLSVSRQAISKWESAQATPDLQKVILLAELFGVSTDYLLKDEIEPDDSAPATDTPERGAKHVVTMEEANDFLSMKRRDAGAISLGVLLCILCPALLILLLGFSEAGRIAEGTAVSIGLAGLFLLIAAGVALFIGAGLREAKYSFLAKDGFETAYGVSGMLKEKRSGHDHTYAVGLTVGIILCILSVLPISVAGGMGVSDSVALYFTALLFPVLGGGVYSIVHVAIVRGGFTFLLPEIEVSEEQKKQDKADEALASTYWCIVIAGYLAWSFLSGDWGKTWIVWPIAGVLFDAVGAIRQLISGGRDKK